MLIENQHYLTYLEAALLNKFMIKQPDIQLLQNFKLLTYFKILQFSEIPNLVGKNVFTKLVSYNIGIKKITRIWDIIKWTVILNCCVILPILGIFVFFSRYTISIFYPVTE